MKSTIITIGDEILIGDTVDSNSAWIAQNLTSLGIENTKIISISDKKDEIINSLKNVENKNNFVFITGGLGPTKDDITKQTICDFFDTKLILNNDILQDIKHIFKIRGLEVSELNRKQAEVPANCTAIHNPIGTAPAMWFEKENIIYIFMPGVPFEMKAIMEKEILPRIKENFTLPKIEIKNIQTQGIPESHLAAKIDNWENNLSENFSLAYLPSPIGVRLRLTARGKKNENLTSLLDKEIEKLNEIIPDFIYSFEKETLEQVIGKLLTEKQKTISTAESCSGGNIAHLLTLISGSSNYFEGSVVAYSNSIKNRILNVPAEIIEEFGAVSKEVVEKMAEGVKALFKTDYAIATSGIAGPKGGTENKPIGTTWIAIATPEKIISQKFLLGDGRERNIMRSSATALNMLRKILKTM